MSLATRIAQEFKNTKKYIGISGVTSYHLLQGNLAVSNYTTTQGFNTTLYTGNSGTQSINTGIDMNTQWGNDVSEKFGGLVWLKGRSGATSNYFVDTARGVTNDIYSNTTAAQTTEATGLTSFGTTGFTLGTLAGINTSAATYASWNFQTTHRVTGTTNHGKAYTCHYNPFTGFTIVKYEGSGLAGHEIPHLLTQPCSFVVVKTLTAIEDWYASNFSPSGALRLNTTDNLGAYWGQVLTSNVNNITNSNPTIMNTSAKTYILYGWANSYFDESNKLIGNYEIGVYQGTGASGNKVSTRGKPAWVMTKRLDAADNWHIFDNQRGFTAGVDKLLTTNLPSAEYTAADVLDVNSDGFTLRETFGQNVNGSQYLYMVAYDTNSNGGGTYYPLASDTANVQVNNALIPIAQGIDSNGVKNTILSKNETVTGVTYTQGKNYVYYDVLGNNGVSAHRPRYLDSDLIRGYAGESPDYYDVESNKWFNCDAGDELVTNGKFSGGVTTGWTAWNYTSETGSTLSIENNTLKATATASNGGMSYKGICKTGEKYKLSMDVIGTNDLIAIYSHIIFYTDNTYTTVISSYRTTNDSTLVLGTRTLSVVADSSYYRIGVITGATSGKFVNIDNVSFFKEVITPTTEITNGRNYLNHIVYADNDGGLLYVEELPKTQYIDSLNVGGYNINFSNSLFTNGYQKLPSGLILQWGLASTLSNATDKTITFPLAFPTACLNVNIALQTTSNDNSRPMPMLKIKTLSQTSFIARAEATYYTPNGYWIAIGY